jgi:hypothetical protein
MNYKESNQKFDVFRYCGHAPSFVSGTFDSNSNWFLNLQPRVLCQVKSELLSEHVTCSALYGQMEKKKKFAFTILW